VSTTSKLPRSSNSTPVASTVRARLESAVASLAAADRRLAEARVRLIEPSDSNGFVNGHRMAHNRTVTAINNPATLRLDEIIATGSTGFEGGQPWSAEIDHFALYESPTEELDRLQPEEFIGAYYRQVGVKWDGGTLLHDNLAHERRGADV